MPTHCTTRSRSTGSARHMVSNATADAHDVGAFGRWLNKRRLRGLSRVGVGARLEGGADLGGGGQIIVGDEFFLLSRPVRSHIYASPGAVITIGDAVQISYGAAIAAYRSIDIGSNTVLGPFAVIMDNDFHRVGDRNAEAEVGPVRIGSNVKVGARVTILRGSVIGDNVRIMSGSMVSGVVPGGVTIGGVPARSVIANNALAGNRIDVAELVQSVLGLSERPRPDQGPADFAAWDSLGSLRLLLALEEAYGVSLKEEMLQGASTVAVLSAMLEATPNKSAPAALDVADLVQSVLGLSERPHPRQGSADFAEWDSLGTLRLLLAIEETYKVSLDEGEMRAGNTVAALAAILGGKLAASVRTAVDTGELV
jgi:acetyltransferase-like isoleucine patch superfamily enzyme/acyl carrier protein